MSNEQTYVVRSGDTLAGIAAAHGTNIQELTALNRIQNPDKIRVGQTLRLPEASPSQQVEDQDEDDSEGWGTLVVQLFDAINRPIKGLKVQLENSGSIYTSTTNDKGVVPAIAVKHDMPPVKVYVERAEGGMKHVASIQPRGTAQHARLFSPKLKVTSRLRRHEGPPGPPLKPEPRQPGDERITRSPNGHPVHEVALECPNAQNLRLQANYKYRDWIIAAAERTGITPHAMAAILNAEAAPIPARYVFKPVLDAEMKPIKGKSGKPLLLKQKDPTWSPGEWEPHSAAGKSSARGIGQFLDGSWIELACTKGTHLNAYAKKKLWLTQALVENSVKGKTVRTLVDAFRLADGTLVKATTKKSLARILSHKPYLTAWASASDANLQALLDLRMEPEYSIHAVADLAKLNLTGLTRKGYEADGLNDGEKGKLAYLTHHLGLGDAVRFIENTITAERAEVLLRGQIPAKDAIKALNNADGDWVLAHRTWLDGYVNSKIKLVNFFCDKESAPIERALLEICSDIKKG